MKASYLDTFAEGNYTATKDTDYTVNATGWSNVDFVVTAKSGFELSLTNTADGTWSNTLTKSDETATGSITFYVRNKSTGAISLAATESYQIDKTAPTGDIKIGENSIIKALNAITFGLFFKETQTITVTADDTGSGVDTVYYKLSSTVLDESALSSITDWTAYSSSFTISPDCQNVVYVKITDKVGHTVYIGSDGMVLDATAPIISGIENGKSYCEDVTIEVTDNNLKEVTVDGVNTTLTDGKLTLSPTGTAQTIIATDQSGNSTSVTVTVYDGHAWNEGVVTINPTAESEGEKTFTCHHCGETRIEKIDKIAPMIIEGQNATVKQDANSTLSFRSNAAFADFLGVTVDGKEIDPSNYTLSEGNIIVMLKSDYLSTLASGKHTIGIISASGTATAEFTIAAKTTDNGSPQAGDNSNSFPWLALLLVSGGTLTVFGVKNKKRKTIK